MKNSWRTPTRRLKGTVKELAEKYEIELMPMVGFSRQHQREPGNTESH